MIVIVISLATIREKWSNVMADGAAPCKVRFSRRHMGVSKNRGYLNFGVLVIRILLFRVLY